ncbi:chitobiase/beta-hexosaminidase C-terminal domain-containing protein [Myxococcus sp. NMCA1]|uniref:chitobiase/beta-hexosaminidase C-terminal domain-containing protein n=1 Tax=Myxococcus sp. NMCA1 TaxID=2996785 RepID=UPI002285B929|nr:chitobiase/beta-hexosaminidase C-terminal domain-containing protein [Myxococcus sp. NMCA1]WAM23570.1 chitobiase/beta-hexosaminidase C-terminal domain-containing protein [Myxococcus sp. NMCA1]
MSQTPFWPLRCGAVLLTAQLVLACGGGESKPPPPTDLTPPATRATPAGGDFTTSVVVTLACDDGGGSGCAATYYTLDGSTPGTGSTQYREPFTLGSTTTVRFYSVDAAGNAEAPGTATFTLVGSADTEPPSTVVNPASGSFSSPRSVALTCDDGAGSGCAATHYTLDGSVPTQASPRYTAPLSIATSTTLRFFSVDRVGNVEAVRQARYVVDTEAPQVAATPRGGTFTGTRVVTLTCDDGEGSGCAAIHYTTNGAIPSLDSSVYQEPLVLTATTRVRFIAVDWAGNVSDVVSELYTREASAEDRTPPTTTATPAGGTYRSTQSVVLACTDNADGSGCAATYYTLDGSAPTTSSLRYSAAISVSTSATLRFFSVDLAGNVEPAKSEQYALDTVAPVTTATPAGGTYRSTQSVVLACTDNADGNGCAATYYTLDGSAPTTSSLRYSAAISISTSATLRFFSVDLAGNVEPAKSEQYTLDTVAPVTTATPAGGTYRSTQSVVLACTDNADGSGCAATYYTLDGSAPTTSSLRYSAAISVSTSATLRFFSVDLAGNVEPAKSEQYALDTVAPVTTATPAGGTYRSTQSVVLACTDNADGSGCAATYYTLDGSAPTTSSLRYSAAISISTSATLRFFSVDLAGNAEPAKSEQYTLDTVAPVTTVSPGGGSYTDAVTVTLSCSDSGSGCRETRYTLDGSAPEADSPVYAGPVSISASTTLRFASVDHAGNVELAKQAVYVLPSLDRLASEQIQAVRNAATGTVNLVISGARITYVKPAVGNVVNDAAGFFLQAEQAGPALFVEVDPLTLSPAPQAGARVRVTVSEKSLVNGQTRARISAYAVLSTGHSLSDLVQDVSGVDVTTGTPPAYESEYISITGTIGNPGFSNAGLGHVQAPFTTAGVPEGSPGAAALRLRVAEPFHDTLALSQGCSLTVVSPLWVFMSGTQTTHTIQPSVWTESQATVHSCPAPRVTGAQAMHHDSVILRFTRAIDPLSVQRNGSQFSIPGLSVMDAVVLSTGEVWLSTASQTPRQQYTVTAASSVRDRRGVSVDSTAASTSFTGYQVPARLRLSEVAPNVQQNRDLVELVVLTSGSVMGATLLDGNATLATLPDVQVASGDIIVIHLNPDRVTPGADAPGSETLSKTQYPASSFFWNYDTAWDFHGTTLGVGTGNRTLRIQDGFDVTQDALAVVVPSNSFAGYPALLQALQDESLWLPANCNGALCTYASFPTAWEVSVDWSQAFVTQGRSSSVQRIGATDSDTRDDWFVGGSSFGVRNP